MNSKFIRLKTLVILVGFLQACFALSIKQADDAALKSTSYSDVKNADTVKVGTAAPNFSLPNSEGKTINLNDITKQQAALVIFYRGGWCPFCINQLDSIKTVLPQLKKHNVQVIAISPDEQSATLNTKRQFGQDFIFLSDAKSEVIAQYGIAKDKKLPHPATYLIKQGGEMVWFYASEDYKKRPTGKQLIQLIETKLSM
ncbi:MAG: peroxiredoxin family protein [Pseudomonadota bacterium]